MAEFEHRLRHYLYLLPLLLGSDTALVGDFHRGVSAAAWNECLTAIFVDGCTSGTTSASGGTGNRSVVVLFFHDQRTS